MSTTEAEARAEGRREAAPAAFVALLVQVGLALISWSNGWELLGLPWWLWLLLATPSLLLMIDLVLSLGGTGLVRSRRGALVLLGLLVLGNFTALAILVAGLVSTTASDLTGSELLLTGFALSGRRTRSCSHSSSGSSRQAGRPRAFSARNDGDPTSSSRRTTTRSLLRRVGNPKCGTTYTSR